MVCIQGSQKEVFVSFVKMRMKKVTFILGIFSNGAISGLSLSPAKIPTSLFM